MTGDGGPAGPVFVVGNSRSGTTMVARMLDLHPEIHTLREVHFFEELWVPADRGRVLDRAAAETLAATLIQRARDRYQHGEVGEQHRAEARRVLDGMAGPTTGEAVLEAVLADEAHRAGASIACEQTPRNVYFAREIRSLFPASLVVAVVRDPRDVLASQKNWWRKASQDDEPVARAVRFRHWASYHPLVTSLLWRGGARAQLALDGTDGVLGLRYEDVLADPETTLRRVTDALGLPFDPAMLGVRRFGSSTHSDVAETGVDASRSGGWRTALRPGEVWVSQRVGAAEYAAFGYEPERMAPPRAGLALAAATLPAKVALTAALNLRRSRGLLASVRRRLAR